MEPSLWVPAARDGTGVPCPAHRVHQQVQPHGETGCQGLPQDGPALCSMLSRLCSVAAAAPAPTLGPHCPLLPVQPRAPGPPASSHLCPGPPPQHGQGQELGPGIQNRGPSISRAGVQLRGARRANSTSLALSLPKIPCGSCFLFCKMLFVLKTLEHLHPANDFP